MAVNNFSAMTSYYRKPVIEVKRERLNEQGFLLFVFIIALIVAMLFLVRHALTPMCGLQAHYESQRDIYLIYYVWDGKVNQRPTWVVRKDSATDRFFVYHRHIWIDLESFLLRLGPDGDWELEKKLFAKLQEQEQSYIEVERGTPVQMYSIDFRDYVRRHPRLQGMLVLPEKIDYPTLESLDEI